MAGDQNYGCPAFPCSNEQFTRGNPQTGDAWSGMSLRDWFAGQVLAGICANPDISTSMSEAGLSTEQRREAMAQSSYAMADALLAARKPT